MRFFKSQGCGMCFIYGNGESREVEVKGAPGKGRGEGSESKRERKTEGHFGGKRARGGNE